MGAISDLRLRLLLTMPMKNPPKDIKRKWNLSTRYGITHAQYEEMLAAQGGLCAICKTVPKRPVVDHDHKTRAVRGILCHGCNVALPAVENEIFRSAAIEYLNGFKK